MDTTRRSSRAGRASQPLQSNPHHSSASSNASNRGDRATRSNNKSGSPRKSTPSNSFSSEPLEGTNVTVENKPQIRRKRGRTDERDKQRKKLEEIQAASGEDEDGDDDEAVRCICGFEDYPGPPRIEGDNKHGIKDGIEKSFIPGADVAEDLAGFFLQCDICKVWQHGGCVGIMNEDTSPDEYFCEECRGDLHRISIALDSQRYSHYLPLHPSISRTTSRAPSHPEDGTHVHRGASKTSRPASSMQNAKRRSTMNSRDAAYDEEEQLRLAIEASRGEKSGEAHEGGTRRGKRGHVDSIEKPERPKRQRTASTSRSPIEDQLQPMAHRDTDNEDGAKDGDVKKAKGPAARNQRDMEIKEEREKLRQDSANKRKGRAERRRGAEDSDPSDDTPLAEKVTAKSAANKIVEVQEPDMNSPPPQVVSETPSANPPFLSHKKGGRPPNARKGKLGRNQYTRDRDIENNELLHRSQSRDASRDVIGGAKAAEGKHRKSKASSSSKVSMADMRRRVTNILEFISRIQVEMAGESSASSPSASGNGRMIRNLAEGLPTIKLDVDAEEGENGHSPKKGFTDLSCPEMMEILTKQLVKWQKEFT